MALTKLNNQSIAALTDFNLSADDMPSGSVLQVQHTPVTQANVYPSSGVYKLMETSLVTKATNSIFIADIHISHNAFNISNRDSYNFSLSLGYKTGGVSGTVGDYTGVGGRTGSQVNYESAGLAGSDSYPLYNTDVPYGQGTDASSGEGTWGSDYESPQKIFCVKATPNLSSGTTINFAIWLKCQNYFVLSGADYTYTNNDYNGAVSSLKVTEIAG